MDLFCPRCGEAWDFDTIHEEAQERYGIPYYIYKDTYHDHWLTNPANRELNPEYNSEDYSKVYAVVSQEFRTKGCKALTHITDGVSCISTPVPLDSEERDSTFNLTRSEAAGALYDILGDDMDGAAAMLDDMGFS